MCECVSPLVSPSLCLSMCVCMCVYITYLDRWDHHPFESPYIGIHTTAGGKGDVNVEPFSFPFPIFLCVACFGRVIAVLVDGHEENAVVAVEGLLRALFMCVCVYVYVRMYVCVNIFSKRIVRRTAATKNTHLHTHTQPKLTFP